MENNSFFRGYLCIHSSYRILPTDCNVVERHGDPWQKHSWRSPRGTIDKGSKLARFRAVEVLLAQLITCVCVLAMSHQDETHLFFIDVATTSISIGSLAEPWELPELANVSEHQVGFQGIFRYVIECKVIFKDEAVYSLSQNRKPKFFKIASWFRTSLLILCMDTFPKFVKVR